MTWRDNYTVLWNDAKYPVIRYGIFAVWRTILILLIGFPVLTIAMLFHKVVGDNSEF